MSENFTYVLCRFDTPDGSIEFVRPDIAVLGLGYLVEKYGKDHLVITYECYIESFSSVTGGVEIHTRKKSLAIVDPETLRRYIAEGIIL